MVKHPAIPIATKNLATMNMMNDVEKAHIIAADTAMKEQAEIAGLLPILFGKQKQN